MGAILMIVGGGLCGLSVLTLLAMVAKVAWDGERAYGAPIGAVDDGWRETHASKPRKRRVRVRRFTSLASLAGTAVSVLLLIGLAGCLIWTVGYLVTSTGSRQDVNSLVRNLQSTSGRHLRGGGGP